MRHGDREVSRFRRIKGKSSFWEKFPQLYMVTFATCLLLALSRVAIIDFSPLACCFLWSVQDAGVVELCSIVGQDYSEELRERFSSQ